ncbi:MAG: YfcE family phosphodiesterase [Syntrophales bacterium]|nr:YfcE family phosphodiesterase [Syntrophales bacterium]MDD5533501.1 YfcE family phosphodiesterase [Syntrophales bacterium]HPL64160.1 YfcE family phosphodiesterase [Syntrophales bacterium]
MKRIVVISDTHEDHDALRMLLGCMKYMRIDAAIHLGDYFDDAKILEESGYPLFQVPGTWDESYYRDPGIHNRRWIEIENWKVFLTHTPESHYNDLRHDPNPEKILQRGEADLFLFGHTHLSSIQRRNGTILVNPGHLNGGEERGCPLTYAMIDLARDFLKASILQLPDNVLRVQKIFRRTPGGSMVTIVPDPFEEKIL